MAGNCKSLNLKWAWCGCPLLLPSLKQVAGEGRVELHLQGTIASPHAQWVQMDCPLLLTSLNMKAAQQCACTEPLVAMHTQLAGCPLLLQHSFFSRVFILQLQPNIPHKKEWNIQQAPNLKSRIKAWLLEFSALSRDQGSLKVLLLAFNMANHYLLIHHLVKAGIQESVLHWLSSFFQDWRQKMVLGEQLSKGIHWFEECHKCLSSSQYYLTSTNIPLSRLPRGMGWAVTSMR